MDARHTEEARCLYEELTLNSTAIGAYAFVSEAQERKYRFEQRQSEIAAVCDPMVVRPGEGDRALLLHAPSPWHAAIHFLVNNRAWLEGRNSAGRSMSLMYRGQRESSWEIVASIDRPGVNARIESRVADTLGKLFLRIMNAPVQLMTDIIAPSVGLIHDPLNPWPSPEAECLARRTLAQHHGVKTQLLDFSVDPCVAVWFACQGAHGQPGKSASVFAIPSEVAFQVGAQMLIPHPYLRRLFRQRGVFLAPPKSIDLSALCIEVRFPPDPSFEVIRNGGAKPLLLPTDRWWGCLVEIARGIVDAGQEEQLESLPDVDPGLAHIHGFLESVVPDAAEDLTDLFMPAFMESENKLDLLVEGATELTQMLLSQTTTIRGSYAEEIRVSSSAIDCFVAGSGRNLRTLLPVMEQVSAGLPDGSVLKQAGGAMIEELQQGLRRAGLEPLDEGWRPALSRDLVERYRDPDTFGRRG